MSRPDELHRGATAPREPQTFRWLDPREAEPDQVLSRLLAEAAGQIPGLSSDPALTDPLVRLLLAAVAKEYTQIYGKLDEVVDTACRQLLDSVLTFPRAPRPASTVLQLGVAAGGAGVDENLVVIGRKAVPEGDSFKERNIHFVPYGDEHVPGLAPPVILSQTQDGTVSVLADGAPTGSCQVDPGSATWLHLGVTVPDAVAMETIPLFVKAADDRLVSGLIWSSWQYGQGGDAATFVPGLAASSRPWDGYGDPPLLRSRSDIKRPESPHDRAFVHLSLADLRRGRDLPPAAAANATAAGLLAADPHRLWLSIRCADDLDPAALARVSFRPNCVVAFNLQTAVARFKVGRARAEMVDLPVAYDQLFRLDEVHDAANVTRFIDAETSAALQAEAVYHLDRSPQGQARLRLVSRAMSPRPRSIEVMYTTTMGLEANGLEAGSVDTVFDRRLAPGVIDAVSVAASAGGQAAPAHTWLTTELRAQLATRGRAVTAHDYEVLAVAYDPTRIREVEVGRGVKRGRQGVSSCVRVVVRCHPDRFHGETERTAFVQGLQQYLEARSPAGQQVSVDLVSS